MEEVSGHLRKAGEIASKLRRYVRGIVKEGMLVLDLCENVEAEILRLGGKPAFPCNVSINSVAAHYTSPIGDTSRIPEGSVVKVDIGVQVAGYIADCAETICFNPKYEVLTIAAQESLETAIEAIKPGARLSDIGGLVQRKIERYGLKPIRNLTGHKIERYNLHAGKSVPNVSSKDLKRFEVGEVYAIEPFVTLKEASGFVKEGAEAHIYRLTKEKGVMGESAKLFISIVKESYKGLPFALRWLTKYLDTPKLMEGFSEAIRARCLHAYPLLMEASAAPVAQAEHTIVVTKDGCEVLTRG